MKILLDKVETIKSISGLGLRKHYDKSCCTELYYDTELQHYVAVQKVAAGHKYTGRILIPPSAIACAQISKESVPKHQPIGTPDELDTPSGKKRKHRTDETAKSTIAERIEARKEKSSAE